MKYTSIFIIAQLLTTIRTDNLVLLSGTLRQFEQNGCEDDQMTLKCPPGTSISVELAQYDKTQTTNKCPQSSSGDTKNSSCSWPTAIQTVVEACQKKKSCKFQASPRSLEGDLCSGERKYVEVAYKCRPYEFRSRVACENERVQLQCNPNSRVAIYSASYGRTEYESFQCPQPQGVAEETCLVSYATETVMQICHGKRHCEFGADSTTFGSPCKPQTKMYLRIVYTCVPQKVLNSEYEEPLGDDETEQDFLYDQDDFDNLDSAKEKIREFAASPGSASNINQYKQNDTHDHFVNSTQSNSKGILSSTSSQGALDTNKLNDAFPNMYIYVILTLGAVSLLCVIIVTSRALVRRHHDLPVDMEAKFKSAAKGNLDGETELDIGIPLPVINEECGHQCVGVIDNLALSSHVQQQQVPRVHGVHVHNTCVTDGYYYG